MNGVVLRVHYKCNRSERYCAGNAQSTAKVGHMRAKEEERGNVPGLTEVTVGAGQFGDDRTNCVRQLYPGHGVTRGASRRHTAQHRVHLPVRVTHR